MKRLNIIQTLGILAVLAFFVPSLALAATGLSIQPVKISQTLKPGDEVTGTILLRNASDEDVNVAVKVEDFIPTAGAETLQFVGRAQGITTVRDWITIKGGQDFLFKKGESRQIEYSIKAPLGAEPGGHFGVAFFKATKASEANSELRIGTQVGMLILITIPGNHLQKGNIQDFTAPKFLQGGPVPFVIKFENTGTVHFEPKGTIKITNMLGREVGSVPIEGQVVLPTGVKNLNFQWPVSSFLLGKYSAVATVVDGDGNILTSKTVSFWAVPVWYIVSFIVLLLVIFFVIKFLKSKVNISINLK
jgi:uncharacterized repeat protein (TIGR01451 family)